MVRAGASNRLFVCLGRSPAGRSPRPPREKAEVMLTVDISLPEVEELQKLVQDGQEKGFLTYDEIVSGLEEVELTKEQIEDFYTYLIDHSIELVEGEQHKSPPHEQPALAEEEKRRRSSTSRSSPRSTRCGSTCARSARCRC